MVTTSEVLIVNRHREVGFTLIELLVVIAIIAILAAILFPVFARAREKARQSSCQSNAKNLGVAMHMYTQDYNEMLPDDSYAANGITFRWGNVIEPYIKNLQIFVCPSDNRLFYNGTGGPTGGYGYNACFLQVLSQSAIAQPAQTILLGDSCGVTNTNPYRIRPDEATAWGGGLGINCTNAGQNGNGWNIQNVLPLGRPCPSEGSVVAMTCSNPYVDCSRVSYRHSGYSNITFVDGHVKAIKYADINLTAATEGGVALNQKTRFVLWNTY